MLNTKYYFNKTIFRKRQASITHKLSIVLMALCLLPISSHSQTNESQNANNAIENPIEEVEVTLKIKLQSSTYGNATLGKLTNTFKKTETGYSVNSVTKAQGIAAIVIGSNEQQSCDFTFDHKTNIATPVSYSGGTIKKEKYRVNFNWEDRIFQFENGETLDMPDGYIMDVCSMPFAIALAQGKGLEEQTMYIIDGKKKRLRAYNLLSSSNETVETSLGTKETLKIVLQREHRPDRLITLWLSLDDQYTPVKVEEKRKSRTTTMLVSEVAVK